MTEEENRLRNDIRSLKDTLEYKDKRIVQLERVSMNSLCFPTVMGLLVMLVLYGAFILVGVSPFLWGCFRLYSVVILTLCYVVFIFNNDPSDANVNKLGLILITVLSYLTIWNLFSMMGLDWKDWWESWMMFFREVGLWFEKV